MGTSYTIGASMPRAAGSAPAAVHHEHRISRAETVLATVVERIDGLERGFEDFRTEIRGWRTSDQQNNRPHYAVLISFAGLILTIVGGFVGLMLWPIRDADADRKRDVAELRAEVGQIRTNTALNTKGLEAQVTATQHCQEHIGQIADRQIEVIRTAAREQGRMDAIADQLQAVDQIGSRRWIDRSTPQAPKPP
jgi:hypothetical protein